MRGGLTIASRVGHVGAATDQDLGHLSLAVCAGVAKSFRHLSRRVVRIRKQTLERSAPPESGCVSQQDTGTPVAQVSSSLGVSAVETCPHDPVPIAADLALDASAAVTSNWIKGGWTPASRGCALVLE